MHKTVEDRSEKALLAIIANEFPDMIINSARVIPHGLDHVILEINGEYIFRFPIDAGDHLPRELAVLGLLDGRIAVPIPHVIFVGKQFRYIGYRRIAGTTLSEEEGALIPPRERKRLARQTALFLFELHNALSIDNAREIGIREYDISRFDKICSVVSAKFRNDRRLVSFAERAVLEFSGLANDPGLKRVLHWDLHNGNMILEAGTYSLNGVIDFGRMFICDVHAEFRSIFRFNPDLARETMDEYNSMSGLKLCFRRVMLYAWLVRLSDLAETAQGPSGRTHQMAMQRLQRWAREEIG
jgi:aminoglycoside phosphotransferase (APT) family kinase protein